MILNPEKDEEEEEDEADDAPEEAEAVTTADTAPAAASTDSTPPGTAPAPPGTAPTPPGTAPTGPAPAAASGPNTTSITVLVNDPSSSKQGVVGTPVSPTPAAAATPALAAKPEKKDEPNKEDEPKAEKEEPKKLSGWEKARNLYSGAKGFYNSDEFSDGKEKFDGLGSSIWNKINSELKLGQAEADMMHLDDEHHL